MTGIEELRSRLLTTDDLIARGASAQALSRAVSTGAMIRLRPGFYVDAAARELSRDDRHLLMVLAADRCLVAPVFTHWSAALVLGLPSWGLPLRQVSVSRNGHAQRSRNTRLTRHDVSPVEADEIVTVGGLQVTSPDRTVVDIGRACGRDTSVAVADAAVYGELATAESLHVALDRAAGRSGLKKARVAMTLMDGRSESVAETLSRLTFSDHCLPTPVTQEDIIDTHGNRVARVDFFWREHGVIGECDGFGKYFDGHDLREVRRRLAREKDRDAELVALGYRVIHWRWADLERPWLLAERIRRVLLAAAA
ncbi:MULTISPECIES: type IV toxin-antitoxin system AbiEi family antitoxin domain-containing protein [unclassified Dietzia]|uniref:type IV toxin-antitoxin system AbiEi family antitoxin domain-containing protein n=1 Tax=unclassified Dietzia TaxID=2617939 RepID=UPI0015F97880|nr:MULTISPECIES: type IV toxin-antitoxin system AbiEi family antitoxin domain-containing protein [unclassified Dietzia]MBB1025318.1 type IV toxin-antitoxin system AbiEi family antitoxin domain-containing protein [Dietzia sp. DQ12-76]MBB1027395.1 type IV toxin-antitoxin system AbiEi family antitoxin domain-containing protein [Dietzia sp. DQ11-38-2]